MSALCPKCGGVLAIWGARACSRCGWRDGPLPGNVPCSGCTLCCQGDALRLLPADDASQYQTVPHDRYPGELMLDHQPNGDCIYLSRETGCTIHERRPQMCREMDCRTLAKKVGYTNARKLGIIHIYQKGKALARSSPAQFPSEPK